MAASHLRKNIWALTMNKDAAIKLNILTYQEWEVLRKLWQFSLLSIVHW